MPTDEKLAKPVSANAVSLNERSLISGTRKTLAGGRIHQQLLHLQKGHVLVDRQLRAQQAADLCGVVDMHAHQEGDRREHPAEQLSQRKIVRPVGERIRGKPQRQEPGLI